MIRLACSSKLNIHDPVFDLLFKSIMNRFLLHPNNGFIDCVCLSGEIFKAFCVCTSLPMPRPIKVPGIPPRPSALAYWQTVSKMLKYNHLVISFSCINFNLFSEMEEELVRAISCESERHCTTRVLWLCRFWPRKTHHKKTRQKDHPPVGVHQHSSCSHWKLS